MISKKNLRLVRTERFRKSVLELDKRTRKKLKRKLELLVSNPRQPSLMVKKIKGTRSIFEARVNDFHRMTFQYRGEGEIILRVAGPHNAAIKKP
jgi:mRNA interferase RelE/StbE